MLATEPSNFFFSTLVENMSVILWARLHYSAGHTTKNPDIAADGLVQAQFVVAEMQAQVLKIQ